MRSLSDGIVLCIRRIYGRGETLTQAQAYTLRHMFEALYGLQLELKAVFTLFWMVVARLSRSENVLLPTVEEIKHLYGFVRATRPETSL
jgi:hypothetical protein